MASQQWHVVHSGLRTWASRSTLLQTQSTSGDLFSRWSIGLGLMRSPYCMGSMKMAPEHEGRQVVCPQCGNTVRVLPNGKLPDHWWSNRAIMHYYKENHANRKSQRTTETDAG